MGSLSVTTTVLRKRKERPDTGVLYLSSSPSPSCDTYSESEYEAGPSTFIPADGVFKRPAASDGLKRYPCTFAGCWKSYSKPSRLAEHERTHTGDVSAPWCYPETTFSTSSSATIRLHYMRQIVSEGVAPPSACSLSPVVFGAAPYMRRAGLHEAILDDATPSCARRTPRRRETFQGIVKRDFASRHHLTPHPSAQKGRVIRPS